MLEPRHGHTERLAAALVARHDFVAVVRLLNRSGIIPMPLKGVLLQQLVYQDPADRLLSDADLLVPPERFDDSLAILRAAGHRVSPLGRAGAATRGPDARLEVDVHGRLFSPGLYDLGPRQMFERGRVDGETFGATVVLPSPLDLYAHLVGNFAKGRHGADAAPQLRDFSAVASRFGLGAVGVARHLERHGLSRAARYALPMAAARGDGFAERVLLALGQDWIGEATASAARRLTTRFGSAARVSLVAPHLVNRSLPRGAASVVAHVALGLRSRLQTRLGR